MTAPTRHIDTGQWLAAFADEVLVHCIGCDSSQTVRASWNAGRCNARFDCRQCGLMLSSDEGHWAGPVRGTGRRPCGYCGHQWLKPSVEYGRWSNSLPTQIAATCPHCTRDSWVALTYARTYPSDACCDPHFGLRLRLAVDTRHGTVWAYNQRHVAELSNYIEATLRLRRNAGNRSMVSRLPTWMKLAKHRDEISKALQKLSRIG